MLATKILQVKAALCSFETPLYTLAGTGTMVVIVSYSSQLPSAGQNEVPPHSGSAINPTWIPGKCSMKHEQDTLVNLSRVAFYHVPEDRTAFPSGGPPALMVLMHPTSRGL